MKIRIPLSGMLRGVKIPFVLDKMHIETMFIGNPIYLDRHKTIDHITEVCPETGSIYADVPDKEYNDMILDSKDMNMCSFEIVKEEASYDQ